MNYKEYYRLRTLCKSQNRVFSLSLVLPALGVVFQLVKIFFYEVLNPYANVLDLEVINVIKGITIKLNEVGNTFYYHLFNVASILFVVMIVTCSILTLITKKRLPYIILFCIYFVDLFFAIAMQNPLVVLIHITILFICIMAVRNQNYDNYLSKNLWGNN